MSRRGTALALLVAAALVALGSGARAGLDDGTRDPRRPAPLEGKAGCERWKGTASGNDPSVEIELVLCDGPDGAVSGQLQWSSLESGYNVRDVSGSWSAGRARLTLADRRIVVDRPRGGWKFCAIDRYELERTVGPGVERLAGKYSSSACSDQATITLERATAPAGPAPSDPAPAPSAPDSAEPPAPAPKASAADRPVPPGTPSGCSCETGGGGAGGAGLAGLFALALVRSFGSGSRGSRFAGRPRLRS